MKNIVVALALVLSGASVVRAQEPVCIVDGIRRPASECTAVVSRPRPVMGDTIERMEILKGSSAAAVYGPDAARGVTVITTKRGASVRPGEDPLGRSLFPPELVMAHQQQIKLTDRQRSAIQDAMKEAQGKFIDLQFRMSAEVENLQRLTERTSPDEAKVLDQLDRVLAAEREIKHVQLTLMIRIKNQLTEQQQATLATLRWPAPPSDSLK